jgi:toxin FitB
MSGYLLDTNLVSELVRVRPEPRVAAWIDAADESLLYLSVLTLGEIRQGLAEMPQGKRRTQLETWFAGLRARFAGRTLPIDPAVADRWGLLAAEAKRSGKRLSVVDGLLAATALHHGFTLVSRNVRDFSDLHVPILDPWNS